MVSYFPLRIAAVNAFSSCRNIPFTESFPAELGTIAVASQQMRGKGQLSSSLCIALLIVSFDRTDGKHLDISTRVPHVYTVTQTEVSVSTGQSYYDIATSCCSVLR